MLALFCFNHFLNAKVDAINFQIVGHSELDSESFGSKQLAIVGIQHLSFNENYQKVDTSKLIQYEKHYDTYTKSNYWFAEVDTNHIGVLDNNFNWLIEPNYCAISAYDSERGLVSARACPFDFSVRSMEYWDELPIYGSWGVADTNGNWIIEPVYNMPISLYKKSQLVFNEKKNVKVPIVNLEEKWLGTFNQVKDFGPGTFILREKGMVGARKVNDEWIAEPKECLFYVNNEEFVMLDSSAIATGGSLNLIRVNKQNEIEKINGFAASFDVLTSMTRFLYLAGEDLNLLNENIRNAEYLQQDSVLTKWFLLRYWNELFGSPFESLNSSANDDDTIDYAFADTIYTTPPNRFYQYIRVDEYDNWFNINLTEKSTYSVYNSTYYVNYGSRGPAYEDEEYEISNLQIINGKAKELAIKDCFKNGDVKPLVSYLDVNFKDSFNFSEEYILGNEYLWKLVNDSLVLFFPKTSRYIGYSEFRYNFSRLAIARKELGRKFLNERRRKKQLLKK